MTADPVAVYSNVGTRYALKDTEHPAGHRGQDFRLPNGGGSPVVAYEECTVVESGTEVTRGFTSILGWYVVARSKRDGKYLGWAHLRKGTRPAVGAVLKPGDQVGLAASGPRPTLGSSPALAARDYPGTAWTAPHIHTTVGNDSTHIYFGTTYDPLPRIQAALVSLAGTEKLTPINQEEVDVPLTEAEFKRIANDVVSAIRYTVWETAPLPTGKGGPETFEQAVGSLRRVGANIETKVSTSLDRQTGYGRRVEIIQETLLPRVLDAISNDEVTLTNEQIATLTGALSSAGIIARLDDATLKQVAGAAADEADRRTKARLAS